MFRVSLPTLSALSSRLAASSSSSAVRVVRPTLQSAVQRFTTVSVTRSRAATATAATHTHNLLRSHNFNASSFFSTSTASNNTTTSSTSSPVDESTVDLNSDPLGSDRGVSYWLYGCGALVFGMVVLGGLTRLTKSGLSMVEWKPTTFLPPTTEEEWQSEFRKYQLFPEYQKVNNQMSLQDFKFIYQMEFYHRLLGRTVGIAFALPCAYFAMRGRINRLLARRLALAFTMGGAQGAVGWWMVKSGLENPHKTELSGSVHVSPYRLAAHLISAFAIFALLFSTAVRVHPSTYTTRLIPNSPAEDAVRKLLDMPAFKRIKAMGVVSTLFVAATVFSGAFVAGNEAGLVYNEFPLMGGRIVPSDIVNPYLEPKWRNLFENHTTVQFNHRMLAISTTTLVIATFFMTRGLKNGAAFKQLLAMDNSGLLAQRMQKLYRSAHAFAGMVTLQASLGIATLLMYVPISLATMHQAGALCLLSCSMWFIHAIRTPTTAAQLVAVARKASPSLIRIMVTSLRNLFTKGEFNSTTLYSLFTLFTLAGLAAKGDEVAIRLKREIDAAKIEQEQDDNKKIVAKKQ